MTRLACGIVQPVSEAGRRVYQSRGFVCKQTHVLSKRKPMPTLAGFPSMAWLTQLTRRTDEEAQTEAVGQTAQRGKRRPLLPAHQGRPDYAMLAGVIQSVVRPDKARHFKFGRPTWADGGKY